MSPKHYFGFSTRWIKSPYTPTILLSHFKNTVLLIVESKKNIISCVVVYTLLNITIFEDFELNDT